MSTMKPQNCITLGEYLKKILPLECAVCDEVAREIIKILNLKENDLIYPFVVQCCGMQEIGSCTIPLPCPSQLYHIYHCTTWYSKPIREYWCVKNMLNDKQSYYEVETDREMKRCEKEYASSATEAIEILKRMGLSEEIAKKLLQEVQ